MELIPGGAKEDLSAAQAKKLLATVRPLGIAGNTRRRAAAELVAELERIYQRKKAADKELTTLVQETGTTLIDLHGIGPSGAARLLVEVGDITRFPNKNHFGSCPVDRPGPPIFASSGDHIRRRLSRGGVAPGSASVDTCPPPAPGQPWAPDPEARAGRRRSSAVNCWVVPQGVTWSSPLRSTSW